MTTKKLIRRIISGGQTGADRAGLEIAEELGIPTGGWCPKGCRTENGPDPELVTRFGLQESPASNYTVRTLANIGMSDGTLIFGKASAGSNQTRREAQRVRKPVLWVLPLTKPEFVRSWLTAHNIHTLNIAGNRESVNPGIGERVKEFLREVLALQCERCGSPRRYDQSCDCFDNGGQ
jgi:hypothetical protein